MYKKILLGLIIFVLIVVALYFTTDIFERETQEEVVYTAVNEKGLNLLDRSEFLSSSTQGTMILIEFHEDTVGLSNFVDATSKREIPTLLLASPWYIEDYCEDLKVLKEHGLEVGAGINSEPFWDVPYEEQLSMMEEAKKTFENCFGEDLKIFNTRYFAYDENTIRAAEELGVEYVFARGTTGNRATVYQPEEYDVKIFSVSNINSPEFGTGSLCDYSYWARAGTPDDFENKLFEALEFDKISPTSHAYLGGIKKGWNEAYLNFFDNSDVDWQSFSEFASRPDLVLPFSEIPQNREVEYVEPKPNVPLEEEENVSNPCSVEEFSKEVENEEGAEETNEEEIIVFHNGKGSMCLEALDFFEEKGYKFTEYLDTESGFREKLQSYTSDYEKSEGVSDSFGYYPIIFVEGRAFSGFSQQIGDEIDKILE